MPCLLCAPKYQSVIAMLLLFLCGSPNCFRVLKEHVNINTQISVAFSVNTKNIHCFVVIPPTQGGETHGGVIDNFTKHLTSQNDLYKS